MSTTKLNRREFLMAAGMSSLVIIPTVSSSNAFAESRRKKGAEESKMLSETDPQAVALGYKADAAKVDIKKWPKKAGTEGAKQFCYNCQFYQFTGNDPKSLASAPCTLFPKKEVAGKGWCNSWAQNPKVKG